MIEGQCFFEDEGNDKIPNCCSYGPGDVGVHCMTYEDGKYCPYFGFNKTRATVVLTGGNGQEVEYNTFWTSISLSVEEWIKKENEWIKRWAKIINQDKIYPKLDKYSVWIESEEINDLEKYDNNTDVIVRFDDGSRWIASFFTYENLNTITKKNHNSGELLFGKYFWSSDMIFIDEISRQRIEEVIKELLDNHNVFVRVFSRCIDYDR
ncbi:hypothetical protein [Caldalkalibacillus mannanilyticus]|uniref:hypothetical protein n=1 Tax=Caldalkalibacillus mannanilyticus TaxID=1418 RepID=UPI001F2F6C0D|nr:hypothetical protein [Caldalkalibacillus mannanilyticus]